MARSKRRSSGRRFGRPRLPIAAIATALGCIGLIIYGCVAINHQIRGYTGGGSSGGQVASEQSPASQASVAPQTEQTPTMPAAGEASPGQGPKVAIIIDDCGYSEDRCKQFLTLPIPITIAILPLSPHGEQIEDDARAAGKSVMLHLPMEPESPQIKPGPGAITTDMTDDQVRAQVEADVDSLQDMPGANNHEGSKATSDPRVMRDVLGVLQKRHMFFIDSMTSGSTVGESTARDLGIPTAERDVFLDNVKELPYIRNQLKQVQDVALRRGSAIAIGHPNQPTAQALAEAIPSMQAAGISFVSAESLVK